MTSNSNVENPPSIVSNILYLVNASLFLVLLYFVMFGWELEHFKYSNMVTLEIRSFPSYGTSFVTCWGLQLSVCMTVFPSYFCQVRIPCCMWSLKFLFYLCGQPVTWQTSLNTLTQARGWEGGGACLSFEILWSKKKKKKYAQCCWGSHCCLRGPEQSCMDPPYWPECKCPSFWRTYSLLSSLPRASHSRSGSGVGSGGYSWFVRAALLVRFSRLSLQQALPWLLQVSDQIPEFSNSWFWSFNSLLVVLMVGLIPRASYSTIFSVITYDIYFYRVVFKSVVLSHLTFHNIIWNLDEKINIQ